MAAYKRATLPVAGWNSPPYQRPMTTISFPRAAADFALQWHSKECGAFYGLAASDRDTRLQALKVAAKHFVIARNFPLAFDTKVGKARFAPALDVLDPLRRTTPTSDSMCEVVAVFAHELGDRYGERQLLSAASKLMWLCHRSPVIIYDSRARKALRAPAGDYATYVHLWRDRYARDADEIAHASAELARDQNIPDAIHDWFRHRVLDLRLWHEGAPERK